MKDGPAESLVQAIDSVLDGELHVSSIVGLLSGAQAGQTDP